MSRSSEPGQTGMGRPLFIFGCGRSGTSLLSRMLDSHPAIGVPYESHLYNRIYPLLRRQGEPRRPQARARLIEELLRTDYIRHWSPSPSRTQVEALIQRDGFAGIVEGLLGAWTECQGKRRWGEKTPQHTLWWREIREGFPTMQVIHVVRDGRDVALSYQAAHFGPKHVYPLAKRWVEYLRVAEEAQAALADHAFITIRYEDLLREPERELRRICTFLGEPFDPAMLAYHQGGAAYPTDPHNEDKLRRPVLSDNAGKWASRMSGRELRIFEAVAGEALERYGYPRAVPDARISRLEAMSCQFLEHPPRRMISLLRNRQGHRLFLERLRLALVFQLVLPRT